MSIRSMMLPAAVAGLLAASPVLAQTTAPAQAAAPTSAAAPAPAAAPATRRDNVVEHRVAELHGKLKITPAEQKPFDDFAQAMRDNARRMDDAVSSRRANATTATAVEQMRAYAALAQSHAEEVNRLVGPFSTLYDALTPEQRKLADQSFRDFSSGRMNRTTRG